ncbi:hypothetical protein IFM89_001039 [Coptis chinensis]|uniref:Uncharacterized protein n=1 Tax=Coptis chinensis TaxID=261450 RepID=A0A835GTL0_9MAGN|nr:hypothetical protein IFM89_001039 [Coptis chinensis]
MRRVLWIGNCTPWQSKELLILLNFKTNCFALDPLELQNKTAKQFLNVKHCRVVAIGHEIQVDIDWTEDEDGGALDVIPQEPQKSVLFKWILRARNKEAHESRHWQSQDPKLSF